MTESEEKAIKKLERRGRIMQLVASIMKADKISDTIELIDRFVDVEIRLAQFKS